MDELSVGSEIADGRYRVEEVLGRGQHAVVYRVRHQRLETVHALKVLTVSSPGVGTRLGEAGARVQHPGLVRVTDVLEVDGQPALLMELVQGHSLETWLAQRETVELDAALGLFRAVAEAVAAAHRAGAVHGDLTPRNVLVPSSPGGAPAMVADLGLAIALQDPAGPKSRTHSGMPMGSPAYQAPEQLRDARHVDARSDVFALGCLLFELACGARAFPGGFGDVVEAIAAGRHGPMDPSVPDGIGAVITSCLQVDPAARPADAGAVLARLDAELAGAPGPPPDPEPAERVPDAGIPATPAPPTPTPAPPAPTSATPPATAPASGSPVDSGATLAALPLALIAAAGVSALLSVALAAVGLIGFGMSAVDGGTPALTEGPCPGVPGEVVGYVWVGRRFTTPTGEVWVVDTDRNVRADRPREENGWAADAPVVCVLNKGLRVRVEGDPVEVPGAVWVPVVAGAIELDP